MQDKKINTVRDYRSLGEKRILLVEDVEMNQYIARQMLESWGFKVALANNGREAVDLFRTNDFDCILMDIQMPEMDGIEAAKQIRQFTNAAKAAVPIIALTANALKGDGEKYLSAGMTDYLAKPFDEAGLFEVISKHLNGNENISQDNNNKAEINKTMSQEQLSDRLYDLSMVRSVSGGDESFIKKMVALFIETVPPNVSDLQKSVDKQDWDQVAKMAHKLKSTVDSMGIKSLKTEIRTVEMNAKEQKSLEEIPALVKYIATVINGCVEQLQSELD